MSGLSLMLAQTADAGEIPIWQWWATGAVVLAICAALAFVSYGTRTGVIARATTKEALRQPLFALMLFIGVLLMVVNTFLP
ncbi:MAG: ABC transporter permease, partial [Planctomycetaceae bacterium]